MATEQQLADFLAKTNPYELPPGDNKDGSYSDIELVIYACIDTHGLDLVHFRIQQTLEAQGHNKNDALLSQYIKTAGYHRRFSDAGFTQVTAGQASIIITNLAMVKQYSASQVDAVNDFYNGENFNPLKKVLRGLRVPKERQLHTTLYDRRFPKLLTLLNTAPERFERPVPRAYRIIGGRKGGAVTGLL